MRKLMLIEDNPSDVTLVRDLLEEPSLQTYHVQAISRVEDAVSTLEKQRVDVILLDLRLPDCQGVETVRTVRESARNAPIVVLTGNDDEQLSLACIHAGAEDYLPKAELRATTLRRAIEYALLRSREAHVRDLEGVLARYRALSSETLRTLTTAALAGAGAVSVRSPDTFAALVCDYVGLLEPYIDQNAPQADFVREKMERIVTALGDANGGPRDMLDLHVAALDQVARQREDGHSRSSLVDARLLALEMMGLLVEYYRVGHRRRFSEREKP